MLAGYLFYCIALLGFGYFTLARRRFDLTALAFFASCFYFLPGFLGFVGQPEAFGMRPVPVLPETYAVMGLVLGALLLSGFVSDMFPVSRTQDGTPPDHWPRSAAAIATTLAFCGAALTWTTVGDQLLSPNKFLLLQELNRWYLLWTTCATLGAVLAYQRSLWGLFVINMVLLFLDLYVGFRAELVVTLLTVVTLSLIGKGPARLVQRWRLAVLVAGLALLMFVYKSLLVAVKIADWSLIGEQLGNPQAWQLLFFNSEPFIIQAILNEVVRVKFSVGMAHLGDAAVLLLPFSNEFGAEPVGFPDMMQPVLFSAVTDYGVGSNFWAEMLSSGGWYLLIVAVFLYCAILEAGSRALTVLSREVASIVATVMVYWAFYIHRNDLLYHLTLTRRLFLAGGSVIALSLVLGLATREWRRAAHRAQRAGRRVA